MVAREFKTSVSYQSGDLVLYDGVLYKFTAAHAAGAWNGSDVAAMDNDEEQLINRIIAAAQIADRVSDFVDTVVFEPSQNEGTRYKYILTNAQDPR